MLTKSRHHIHPVIQFAAAALSGCVLLVLSTGCARHEQVAESSQVVAKVNGHAITIAQLQQVLLRTASVGASATPDKRAIDSLIDQELLMQKAVEFNLDRDPAVIQAMEQARREILARAYAERQVFPKSEIAAFEKEQYYKSHPALFEHRRLYRLATFSIRSNDLTQALRDDLDEARSSQEVSELLGKHNVNFDVQRFSREAEQLPLDMLPQFAAADIGDVLVAPQPDGKTLLISVMGLDDDPMTLEQAASTIEEYLINERDRRSMQSYIRGLRAAATIDYVESNAGIAASSRNSQREYIKKGLAGLN